MGLSLETGILSDLKSEDIEGFNHYKNEFDKLYGILKKNGIQTSYREPEDLGKEFVWSSQMYGYGGLHYLRRLAAHIWEGKTKIKPGNNDSSEEISLKLKSKFLDISSDSEPEVYRKLDETLESIFNNSLNDSGDHYVASPTPQKLTNVACVIILSSTFITLM